MTVGSSRSFYTLNVAHCDSRLSRADNGGQPTDQKRKNNSTSSRAKRRTLTQARSSQQNDQNKPAQPASQPAHAAQLDMRRIFAHYFWWTCSSMRRTDPSSAFLIRRDNSGKQTTADDSRRRRKLKLNTNRRAQIESASCACSPLLSPNRAANAPVAGFPNPKQTHRPGLPDDN